RNLLLTVTSSSGCAGSSASAAARDAGACASDATPISPIANPGLIAIDVSPLGHQCGAASWRMHSRLERSRGTSPTGNHCRLFQLVKLFAYRRCGERQVLTVAHHLLLALAAQHVANELLHLRIGRLVGIAIDEEEHVRV